MDERENGRNARPYLWIAIGLIAATVAATVAFLLRRRRGQAAEPVPRPIGPPPQAVLDLDGLTEAEAKARHLEGQDNVILFKPPRSQREIWRSNIYTIFNLSLVGLIVVQLLLGKYLDALISLGLMALNIGLNAGQELLARRRLRTIEGLARPQAIVIREARARAVDPGDIVRGDILVAGPGDQILVDGQVVGEGQIAVDESMLTGDGTRHLRRAGEPVYAGSFCVSGRAAYKAQKVGQERLIVSLTGDTPLAPQELTPLERIVDRVLRVLLLIVALFAGMLVIQYYGLDTSIPVDLFNDAASVIFGMAPAGLFFMILLTYASGTVDLAKIGALVHRARSVEVLANTNVLCFAQAGILTGTHVEVEASEPVVGQETLPASRLRQILGDYACSTAVDNLATRAMISTFPGTRRVPLEEAPFLSVYGFSTLTFDDDDLRGVYVLGDPDILAPYLVATGQAEGQEEGDAPQETALQRVSAPVGRFFQRARQFLPGQGAKAAESGAPLPQQSSSPAADDLPGGDDRPSPQSSEGESTGSRPARALHRLLRGRDRAASAGEGSSAVEAPDEPHLLRRVAGQIGGMIRRQPPGTEGEKAAEEPEIESTAFLFAYHPEPSVLLGSGGEPSLPEGLIPLCTLHYTERVRPEAIETIRGFAETGVQIKIFTPGDPDQTVEILRQAGLGGGDDTRLQTLSGTELAGMESEQLARTVAGTTVFGHLKPEQAAQVVAALRDQGQSVVVVGDGANDLPALRQANLAIARQGSSQAALSIADIVVLEESPAALLRVLDKGQRIVNGLLDVLKLYLTQVFYLALLIMSIHLLSAGFPYRSAQGSVITIVTVQIPALALTFWAAAGVLPSRSLGWLLTRLLAPATITMSAAALAVYLLFLGRTGEVAYAQLGLTHVLVATGLLLVVFVKPPGRARWMGGAGRSDWRAVILALGLMAAFLVLTWIPLAQRLLYVGPLRDPADYATVAVVTLVWAGVAGLLWWLLPLQLKGKHPR